ncbi:MAG: MFS transporter, partial [Myxococcota bacterium]
DAMGVAILGEALAFYLAPRLFSRSGAAPWVLGSLAISALRWWLTATVSDPGWLVLLQGLHFFTFGVWYAAAIDRIGAFAGDELRATYQGVFSAGVLALGSTLGTYASGWLMEFAGGSAVFGAAAVCDLVALVVAASSWRLWATSEIR